MPSPDILRNKIYMDQFIASYFENVDDKVVLKLAVL